MKILTSVKRVLYALFCAFIGNVAFADVEYAYVVEAKNTFVYERSREDKKDYAKAFEGVDVRVDGDETDDGVFGMPTYMIIKSNNKCYLLILNNTYGVIGVHTAKKKGDLWISKGGESRDISLPSLYGKLKAMGLKILTPEEVGEEIRKRIKN